MAAAVGGMRNYLQHIPWLARLVARYSARPALDVIVSSASPGGPLEERLNWLVNVVQWIRRPGHEDTAVAGSRAQVQAGRLRRFLDLLERNPDGKRAVAQTLRSIVRETNALELFSETGLPRPYGLLREVRERLINKIAPTPPGSAELSVLFDRLFPQARDDRWLEQLEEATVERFCALLEFGVTAEDAGWNTLAPDLADALLQIAAQLRVSGCSTAVRSRIKDQRLHELPGFKLSPALAAVLAARERQDQPGLIAELNFLHELVEGCHRVNDEVLAHLETHGVSTEVVYHLAFIEASLQRFEALLDLTFNPERPWTRVAGFVALLVRENQARRSVRELLRRNFQLLTRKLVERSAETGEHYIARTAPEYREMLRNAAGGGAITGLTIWFKTIIFGWHLAGLLQGLAASLNYAVSFVGIQLCGFALATKQPATTAPALAARMHHVREPAAREALVDEIVFLIRSQFAAVVGNLCLVVPTVLGLHLVIWWLSGGPLMNEAKATTTLHSLSLLGPSFFFAALTGGLLWASSLVAAATENWFVYHRVGAALEADPWLRRLFGARGNARIARFLTRNSAGFGGNISLGFMLGLLPELAAFAGLPLDVRHVTLSAGAAAAAVASLGSSVLLTGPFWLAAAGILLIGGLNVGVSFLLAMLVAIRARDVRGMALRAIYQAIGRRLWQHPVSFVLPVAVRHPDSRLK